MAVVLLLLLARLVLVAVAFGITAWLLPGMDLSGGALGYLWVSVLFGLVSAVVGTFLRLITLPFAVFTLGLVAILVNAVLLEIVDALTDHLTIDEFWWTAIWASIILAVVLVALDVGFRLLVGRRAADRPPAVAG